MSGEYEYGTAMVQLDAMIRNMTNTIENFEKNNNDGNLTVAIGVLKQQRDAAEEIVRAIEAGHIQ